MNDSRVNVFKPNGAEAAYDLVALETQFGANVAVGDVDGDGSADLIVGAGLVANNPALVRIYRLADKSLITSFTPFGSLNGIKVAAGDLNGDGRDKNILSFKTNDDISCGARPEHLRNQEIVVSEIDETGEYKTYWDKVFVD